MEKFKISVLVHTLNEERNIEKCLETVKWAEDIVIVDMYSDDHTVEIAKKYTNRIFYFEKTGYVEPARQFALEKAKNEWILIVDADEQVPYEMYKRIVSIIKDDSADVVFFPRNNYFFGYLMEGAWWGALQDSQSRLFKKKYISLKKNIHSFYDIHKYARIVNIKDPKEGFIHFNYVDVEHFLEKLNRYTSIEAVEAFKNMRNRPLSLMDEIKTITKEFIKRFFVKKGYKDGIYGLYLSILMVSYRVSVFLKLRLMLKYNTDNPSNSIKDEYDKISKDVIIKYDRVESDDK